MQELIINMDDYLEDQVVPCFKDVENDIYEHLHALRDSNLI